MHPHQPGTFAPPLSQRECFWVVVVCSRQNQGDDYEAGSKLQDESGRDDYHHEEEILVGVMRNGERVNQALSLKGVVGGPLEGEEETLMEENPTLYIPSLLNVET
jgi:hypothetical protein